MSYQDSHKDYGRRGEYFEPSRALHCSERSPSGLRLILLLLGLLVLGLIVLAAMPDDEDVPGAEAAVTVQGNPIEADTTIRRTGKVTSGVATIRQDQEFCFSLGKAVSHGGDFHFRCNFGWEGPHLYADQAVCLVGAWELEDVKAAPELETRNPIARLVAPRPRAQRYDGSQPLNVGDCYVVLCADEVHYAKIRVMEFDVSDRWNPKLTFQWAYQPNGTRTF